VSESIFQDNLLRSLSPPSSPFHQPSIPFPAFPHPDNGFGDEVFRSAVLVNFDKVNKIFLATVLDLLNIFPRISAPPPGPVFPAPRQNLHPVFVVERDLSGTAPDRVFFCFWLHVSLNFSSQLARDFFSFFTPPPRGEIFLQFSP